MADLSSSDLKKEIEKILKGADLAVWTTKKVIQQLGKDHDADFRSRKAEIDKMVLDYIDKMEGDSEEEEEKPKKKEESEQDESSEEEKPKPKRGRRAAAAPKGRVTKEKTKKGGGKGGTGFTRTYKLSPALADLMGSEEMPRHAVVKRIWEIVKTNNLYDPNNKQFAICDDKLYKVIGKQRFRVFGMMKHLKGHFLDE